MPNDSHHNTLGRRRVVQWTAGAAMLPWTLASWSQQRRPTDPLLLGVESFLEVSGLALHLLRAVTRETGLPVEYSAADGAALVARAERGELDVVITQAPQAEELMERRGLVHDRRLFAVGEYVIVGPGGKKGDPAQIRGLTDAAAAFARIAATGAAGRCSFVTTGGTAGAQAAEAALWKAVGPQPAGTWLKPGPAGPSAALEMAHDLRAYALVERGVFAATASRVAPGLEVMVRGDIHLAAPYHVMRAFRVNHPGGKLLLNWLTGRGGRTVLTRFGAAYRSPSLP